MLVRAHRGDGFGAVAGDFDETSPAFQHLCHNHAAGSIVIGEQDPDRPLAAPVTRRLSEAEGEREVEAAPGAELAFHRNRALHPLDQTAADRETHARTAEAAADRGIRLLKIREQAWQDRGFDADAGVAYGKVQRARIRGRLFARDLQRDAAGRGELHGVVG